MILLLTKKDKTENLSKIRDFASMLKISDDEVMDIVQVIKMIFTKNVTNWPKLKTRTIQEIFDPILKMNYNEEDGLILC